MTKIEIESTFDVKSREEADEVAYKVIGLFNSRITQYKSDAEIEVLTSDKHTAVRLYKEIPYGVAIMLQSVLSEVAKEYGLNGETNQHDFETYDPPQKVTYENGETVYWDAVVSYKRRGE